jgi:NAD+ synthase
MPIHQNPEHTQRALDHIEWLKTYLPGKRDLTYETTDLTETFETFRKTQDLSVADHKLSMANTRARLRMTQLYAYAGAHNRLVIGTGNKIEDYGVGFFSKWGDGGVDESPIGDLTKTQVRELSSYLGIISSILYAPPSDGLWDDGRTDEDQLKNTYTSLEWAMEFCNRLGWKKVDHIEETIYSGLHTEKQKTVLNYLNLHQKSRHKLEAIPVCTIPKEYL